MSTSGFIVKATCDSFSSIHSMGLRSQKNETGEECGPGFHELVVDLADTFDLIPASVMLFSLHSGTKLMVHLGSQADLDVVLAEAMEWGSHVITVNVTGMPARRALDAVGCVPSDRRAPPSLLTADQCTQPALCQSLVFMCAGLVATAATVTQLMYLYWIVMESVATFYQEFLIWSIMIFALM